MSILPWLHRSLSLILALSLTQLGQAALYYNDGESLPGGKIASWSSDSGLNPNNPLDRELLDIYATQYPFMPGYSKELLGKDKFRGDFGPTLWRAVLEQFQIIGMGQDATHIAEASGRTATAGFGGRVTQFMEYFGAVNGVWLNAFANTIKGQYGAYGSPIVYFDNKGQPQVKYTGFVDTPLWMMSQDLTSPMVEARNNIIEWILRKSLDNEQRGSTSAKLFALFGGAARDAMASFIISRGGKVGTRTSEVQAKKTQVPEMKLMYAGGNNEFPVPLNKEGKDLYQELAKKYEGRRLNYKKAEDQSLAQNLLRKHLSEVLGEMAFTYGGPNRNGMIHAAQLGGYDLWNVEINGEKTISLKGLRLSDGTTIKHDILFVQFPHPSALSRMSKEDASSSVNKALKVLEPYAKKGWKITPEDGLRNKYAAGVPYVYGRTDIGPQNYDFGAPRNRMVPVSSAVRNGSNKITIGIRDPAKFPSEDVKAIEKAAPAEDVPMNELLVSRPSGRWVRYQMDRGPGKKYARLMTELLQTDEIEKTKPGKSWKKNGVSAYYVKSHPDVGPFGHYRGTFESPRVLILADPVDYNDMITSRALSGTRGQYLQGLMNDLGIGERYLILKTVPYIMDGATEIDWQYVLEKTEEYRQKIIDSLLKENKVDFIIADGRWAAQALERAVDGRDIPIFKMQRNQADPRSNYGIVATGNAIRQNIETYGDRVIHGRRANIPRSHLPYLARWAEGIYGDLVVPTVSTDKNRGRAFQFIMPDHARKQRYAVDGAAESGLASQVDRLVQEGFPSPKESIKEFFGRISSSERSLALNQMELHLKKQSDIANRNWMTMASKPQEAFSGPSVNSSVRSQALRCARTVAKKRN